MLSLAHLTLLGLTPPQLLDTAAEAGFDAVSLRVSPAYRGDPHAYMADTVATLATTVRMISDTGVRVMDVEVIRLDADTDLRDLEPVIDVAQQLGAAHLLVCAYDPEPARISERFNELCELAQPSGLRPVLECIPYSQVTSVQLAVQLVRGSSGAVLIDALHLQRSGGRVADLKAIDPRLIPYVQICDAPLKAPDGGLEALKYESREDRLVPGEGQLPLSALLAAIPEGAAISVESPSRRLRAELGDVEFAKRLRTGAERLLAARHDMVAQMSENEMGKLKGV